ncbi:MAG: hypothetical protein GXX93_01875, partial [Anaerolineae bacterium]|nr:hypothetical protein [Anaerolineae bacterium]
MFDLKTSCRRIMAAYRGEAADRVPIASPISWQPYRRIDEEKPGGWRAEPDFIRVARLVEEHCDPRPPYSPVPIPRVFSRLGYQRFCEVSDDLVVELPVEKTGPIRSRHTYVLPTPKGDLTWAYEKDEGIETSWDVKKTIETSADVEKLMSVPFSFEKPDSALFEPFRAHRREMRRDCIGGVGINSMVAMLV